MGGGIIIAVCISLILACDGQAMQLVAGHVVRADVGEALRGLRGCFSYSDTAIEHRSPRFPRIR